MRRKGQLDPGGYAVRYARGKGEFRVYITSFLAVAFTAVAIETQHGIAVALALLLWVATYYFYPLIENDRARLGANQYGVFIEGFGLIAWRGISGLRIATRAVRNIEIKELEITLSRPLSDAIVVDWRDLPWHRILMRLPWRMPNAVTVLVDMEPFESDPETILAEFERRWHYFG